MPAISHSSASPLITITTDFGTEDAYVPSMKGTMLSICPGARLVDVTHEITPQDVMEAAFVLRSTRGHFPDETIHLVVVDPGVGTDRRAVALRADGQWFVGPDNGVFPLVLDQAPPDAMVELDDPDFWRNASPSTTFHGRDIFAPAAAHLAAGRSVEDIGTPIDTLEPLQWARPSTAPQTVQGWVVHIDHFGNCITNIRRSTLADAAELDDPAPPVDAFPPFDAYVGNTVLEELHPTYGAVPEGDPLLLFGSTDHLEIAANGGNAAELLGIRKGDSVKFVLEEPSE
ncbi:MAG: S-adenosyl-l-methionine hydroxide adenosyltransferase family protein [Salinibacter sp.]